MNIKTFNHFFLFCIACTLGLGIIFILYGSICRLNIHSIDIYLFIAISIAYSVSMGWFGILFAHSETIDFSKNNFSIQDVKSKLNSIKYKNTSIENNNLVFSTSKYCEWFYGKIYVKENGDKITITASNNILNKYFRHVNK